MLSKKETEKIKWSSLCFFFCSNWHHSNEGMQPQFCVVIHTITDSVLAVHVTMVPICNLEKITVFSCHRVSFSDWFFRVPALIPTCFRYIFCNHFVFENATNIAFLLCYWKNKKQYFLSMLLKNTKNTLDPDGCILLKLVYRVDRATSQQSTARKGL